MISPLGDARTQPHGFYSDGLGERRGRKIRMRGKVMRGRGQDVEEGEEVSVVQGDDRKGEKM